MTEGFVAAMRAFDSFTSDRIIVEFDLFTHSGLLSHSCVDSVQPTIFFCFQPMVIIEAS